MAKRRAPHVPDSDEATGADAELHDLGRMCSPARHKACAELPRFAFHPGCPRSEARMAASECLARCERRGSESCERAHPAAARDTQRLVRFLSCEPLLAPVDLVPFLYDEVEGTTMPDFGVAASIEPRTVLGNHRWRERFLCPIVRCAMDPRHRRSVQGCWNRFVREAARCGARHSRGEDEYAAGFSFHHYDPENQLHIKKLEDSHGGNPEEWPEDLRVREFPEVAAA
jgi:hypothetical protein